MFFFYWVMTSKLLYIALREHILIICLDTWGQYNQYKYRKKRIGTFMYFFYGIKKLFLHETS